MKQVSIEEFMQMNPYEINDRFGIEAGKYEPETPKCIQCNENEVNEQGDICMECWREIYLDPQIEVLGDITYNDDLKEI